MNQILRKHAHARLARTPQLSGKPLIAAEGREGGAALWRLDADVAGPVNLTAPNPSTNSEFTKTLGKVLGRPTTILPMFGPRLLYGRELADSLLLTSQRIVPASLTDTGFAFDDPELEGALRSVLGR